MYFTESGRPPLPGSRTIAGYALAWNVVSAVRPTFDEVFLPGALTWPDNLPLCLNHQREQPLIRLGPAFRLRADDVGLFAEVDADAINDGERYLHGARHGGFRGWSISFIASKEYWDRSGGHPLRTVERARLIELSIADRGAHVTTISTLAKINERRGIT